jgi:glucan biosynthesis protein C
LTRAGSARLPGFDAWRAGLMIAGLFFHAIPWGTPGPLFTVVEYLSGHFRMGAFIAISGFLTGTARQHGTSAFWLRDRLLRLTPPLLTGIAFTVATMAFLDPAPARGVAGLFRWYHMWFLVALITYLPLAAALVFGHTGDLLCRKIHRLAARFGSVHWAIAVGLCLTSFVLLVLGSALVAVLPSPDRTILSYVPLILCYAPVYALATLLGRDANLRAACLADVRLPAALLAILFVSDMLGARLAPAGWGGLTLLLANVTYAVFPGLGALIVLRSALALRAMPAWLAPICNGFMTIYIVHLPVIAAMRAIFGGMKVHPYIVWLIVAVGAGVVSWLFHAFVVCRSRTLLWLFNGVRPPMLSRAEAEAR